MVNQTPNQLFAFSSNLYLLRFDTAILHQLSFKYTDDIVVPKSLHLRIQKFYF